MAWDRRLLILSCSQRKRSEPDSLPAVERYDGPMFQVLRKFLRECHLEAQDIDIFILSAEFGLIPASKPIPNYDRRMTPHRASELQPKVLAELGRILKREQYQELFISMGKDYLWALAGYGLLVPADLKVTVSKGGHGHLQAKLHDWLRGRPPSQQLAATRKGKARIRGIEITLTPEQVLDVARRALAEGQGDPTRYQAWYVQVDDQHVAPKWLVSQLTGLSVKDFITNEARRVLAQLGIEVIRI